MPALSRKKKNGVIASRPNREKCVRSAGVRVHIYWGQLMNEVAKAAQTEHSALLEDLSKNFRRPLIAYFLKRTRNSAEVEDLVQETFYRIIRRSDGEKIRNPEAFLFQTAANLLRDHARREATQASSLSSFADVSNTTEVISPERVLQSKQSLKSILAALDSVSEVTRDIFILHRLENMKYKEIASLYGISQSAVEKHMMKAIAHLIRSREEW